MDIQAFIEDIPGKRKTLMAVTGLSKGRISQWVVDNDVPDSWLKFLSLKYPAQARKHGLAKAAEGKAAA